MKLRLKVRSIYKTKKFSLDDKLLKKDNILQCFDEVAQEWMDLPKFYEDIYIP